MLAIVFLKRQPSPLLVAYFFLSGLVEAKKVIEIGSYDNHVEILKQLRIKYRSMQDFHASLNIYIEFKLRKIMSKKCKLER